MGGEDERRERAENVRQHPAQGRRTLGADGGRMRAWGDTEKQRKKVVEKHSSVELLD